MPRTKQNIPANENNSQRFVRIANSRVNSILTSLKQLGALGNPSQYESKPEQRKRIKEALEQGLTRAIQSMERGESAAEFKL